MNNKLIAEILIVKFEEDFITASPDAVGGGKGDWDDN